jgi:hypothetical protein
VPALPWKSFNVPESDGEYPALLSHLPLNTFRALPKFMRYTLQIRRQLARSEGLIGYSLDANVPGKEFWTLSVWRDRESLWRFVQRMPHSRAMTDLVPHMRQTEFFHFKVMEPPFRRTGKRPSGECESGRGTPRPEQPWPSSCRCTGRRI